MRLVKSFWLIPVTVLVVVGVLWMVATNDPPFEDNVQKACEEAPQRMDPELCKK